MASRFGSRGVAVALGVATNLVPDEHLDFHWYGRALPENQGSLSGYVDGGRAGRHQSGRRERARDGRPVAGHPVRIVGVTSGDDPKVTAVTGLRTEGRLHLHEILAPLPAWTARLGRAFAGAPGLGVHQVANAALAATAALSAERPLGVTEAVAELA